MELLISEIKKRNMLWNQRNIRYKDRIYADKEWGYIAESTGFTKEEARKKWRSLRDQFAKELKKLPKSESGELFHYQGKWQYFTSLLFLRDSVSHRDAKSNIPEPQEPIVQKEDIEDFDLDRNGEMLSDDHDDQSLSLDVTAESTVSSNFFSPQAMQAPCCSKRKKNGSPEHFIEHQMLETESKEPPNLDKQEDDDLMFFKSLLPYIKKLNPIQKLRIRSKFQNILIEEMTNPLFSIIPSTSINHSSLHISTISSDPSLPNSLLNISELKHDPNNETLSPPEIHM
ncbi:uncharacterized protein [Diabrotica undecimpunctata]|uniref:uncharacterized protein n=1 Tax=Diabrotica undecimpunctata TaxID=50387 RepID=UPI003B63BB78